MEGFAHPMSDFVAALQWVIRRITVAAQIVAPPPLCIALSKRKIAIGDRAGTRPIWSTRIEERYGPSKGLPNAGGPSLGIDRPGGGFADDRARRGRAAQATGKTRIASVPRR
jgi:hypothetical protein